MVKLSVNSVNASAVLALCWCVMFDMEQARAEDMEQARAEDQLQSTPTIESRQERRVILPAMKMGGFIDGRSILITARGAKIVTREQPAHKQIMVLGPSQGSCTTRLCQSLDAVGDCPPRTLCPQDAGHWYAAGSFEQRSSFHE